MLFKIYLPCPELVAPTLEHVVDDVPEQKGGRTRIRTRVPPTKTQRDQPLSHGFRGLPAGSTNSTRTRTRALPARLPARVTPTRDIH